MLGVGATFKFGLGCLRFRWVGGRCAQVSPLTLGVYTTIGVSTIFGTVRSLLSQKDPIPLYYHPPCHASIHHSRPLREAEQSAEAAHMHMLECVHGGRRVADGRVKSTASNCGIIRNTNNREGVELL